MTQASKDDTDTAADLTWRLLDAMLAEAPFSGWSRSGLRRATRDAGLSEGEALIAAPRGVIDLLDAWHVQADTAMVAAVQDAAGQKIRVRATLAVRTRLEAIAAHKEAARRAAITLALPGNAPEAVKMGWRTADLAWRAMGDTATDFNWYTKRTILAGVFTTTFAFWLQDDSTDHADTWAFLDRRIENVMQFEKVKAKVNEMRAKLPDPVGLLTALRYGRQPRP
ncbi:MAG: COQ9 family protein [Hyphomonadaceae bacterium]|nr:COQ9 family protein [Hyphomonadaceae bacterium]